MATPDAQNWNLAATWTDRLNTLLQQKADIEESASVQIGGLTVTQQDAYDRTVAGIAECRIMIPKISGETPASSNNLESTSADTVLF